MNRDTRTALFTLLVITALVVGGCASLFNVANEEPPRDPLILSDAVPTSVDSEASSFTALVATDIEAVDDLFVGDDVAISGDLDVAGSTELDGGFTVDDTAFIVANTTGNTTVAGTGTVAGKLTVSDAVLVDGDSDEIQIQVQGHTTQTNSLLVLEQSDGTDKFTVSNDGNALAVGTLGSTGNFAVNTDKFAVTAASGNTDVAGTLQYGANDLYPVGYASSGQQLVYGTSSITGTASHGLTTVTFCLATLGEDPTSGAGDAAHVTVAVSANACTLKAWQDDFVTAATEADVAVHWLVIGAP